MSEEGRRSRSQSRDSGGTGLTLHVSGLDLASTDACVRTAFESLGRVGSVSLVRDR